jgi:hypothetical protein
MNPLTERQTLALHHPQYRKHLLEGWDFVQYDKEDRIILSWLPCSDPECWGVSKWEGSSCTRANCLKNDQKSGSDG